ncbi:hypothetical protein DVV98_15000 [Enterococcus faecium]|nr:hypothetical protein DVV98_15000 [Enterococcus faecium]
MLMSMNLTKLSLEARRKAEAFQHKAAKNKKRDEAITFMIIHRVFYIGSLSIRTDELCKIKSESE